MNTLLRKKCPAWGKVCLRCKKKNHFAKGCKEAAVNAIESDEDLEEISVVRVQAMMDKDVGSAEDREISN